MMGPCDRTDLKCLICEKTFSSSYYLQYHVNYVHSDKKIFTCEHCMKTFKAPNHLKVHIKRLHNMNKQYFCEQCSASFGLKYDLAIHKKTHVKLFEFMCEYCDKTLANKRSLEEHKRIHTHERPYKCQYQDCNLRFGQKKTLRVHMRLVIVNNGCLSKNVTFRFFYGKQTDNQPCGTWSTLSPPPGLHIRQRCQEQLIFKLNDRRPIPLQKESSI